MSILSVSRGDHAVRVLQDLNVMRQEEEDMCDFVLHATDVTTNTVTSFPCHSAVLAANSPVWKDMVKTSLKDSKKEPTIDSTKSDRDKDSGTEKTDENVERRTPIHLDFSFNNISPNILQLIVQYAYTGQMTFDVSHSVKLIEAVSFLKMEELKNLCIESMMSSITTENCVLIFQAADKLQLTEIRTKSRQMIVENYKEVTYTTQFYQLNETDLHDCQTAATAAVSFVNNEDLVTGLMLWLQHDQEQRSQHLPHLLQDIKLEKCSVHFLKDVSERYSVLLDNQPPHVYKLIMQAIVNNKAGKYSIWNLYKTATGFRKQLRYKFALL